MGNFCQTDTRSLQYSYSNYFKAPETNMHHNSNINSKIDDIGHFALQKNTGFENQALEARIIAEAEFLTHEEISNNDYIVSIKTLEEMVIVASKNGKFSVYNSNLNQISSFSQPSMCGGIEIINKLGKSILLSIASDFDSTSVDLWDVKQREKVDSLGKFSERIWNIKIFENSNNSLLCFADGSVEVWDLDNLNKLQQIKQHSQPVTDAITYQNDYMITGSKDNSLIFYNLKEKSLINKVGVSDWIYCLCLINTQYFCAGVGQGEVQVFRIQDLSLQNTFKIHDDYIGNIILLDFSYVMTSSKDGKNLIFSLVDGKVYNDCEKTTTYESDAEPLCKIKSKGLIIYGNANNIVSYGYFLL